MAFKDKMEDKMQRTEKKLMELSLNLKRIDREYQGLLEEMAISAEQLEEYARDEKKTSSPIWIQLQNEQKKLDEQLNLELNAISDPSKTKKTQSERGNVQRHWLFVR